MNTLSNSSSSSDKVKTFNTSTAPNKKRATLEGKGEDQRALHVKKGKESGRPVEKKAIENKTGLQNGSDKKSTEIDEYMKIVSRLENKLKTGDLEEKDLEKITTALEKKIKSLSDQQKSRLKKMKLFKKEGIKNIKDIIDSITKMFRKGSERERLFSFLKDPEFLSILMGKEGQWSVYSPPQASPQLPPGTMT